MKKILYSLIIFLLLTGIVSFTYASFHESSIGIGNNESAVGGEDDESSVGESTGVQIKNPLEADNISELFRALIDIVLVFAVPIIVFFIIYAGFLYVTARGNEGTIEKAHRALLYALIGGLLILGARVLIDVVQGTVDCVQNLEGNCE